MREKVIYLFVFLVISLFVISACEGIKGGIINKGEFNSVEKEQKSELITSYVDTKVKDKSKEESIYFDEDLKKLSINNIPIVSFESYNDDVNNEQDIRNINNIQNQILSEDDLKIRTAVASDSEFSINALFTDGRLISTNYIYSQNPNVNFPLIRNEQIVYEQGKDIIFEIGDFNEYVLEWMPELEDAVTLRYKLYYFEDSHEYNTERLYERLGELGNDMDYEILITKGMLISDLYEDEPVFKRWFLLYSQYFDEDNEAIDELTKTIFAFSTSEERLLERFNRDYIGGNAFGMYGLISSIDIEENSREYQYKGALFGIRRNRGERATHPQMRITHLNHIPFSCNEEYLKTWYDEDGNRILQREYNIMNDICVGFRCLSNINEINPSCYNEERCNEFCDIGTCLDVDRMKNKCRLIVEPARREL